MKQVIDNAAGPTGVIGIIVAYFPQHPKEWLIALSILLVVCQLVHWAWRFCKWCKILWEDVCSGMK